MQLPGSEWIRINLLHRKAYLVSFHYSLLVIIFGLLSKCLFSDAKEHYRRYNVGTKYSGNLDKDNQVPTAAPEFDKTTDSNVTVEKGQAAFLDCKVKNQGSYMVSWVRYTKDFNIVAIGEHVFIPDNRFSLARNPGSSDWTLRILSVKQADAGVYECQIGMTPKMGRNITLQVSDAPQSDSEDTRPRVRTTGDEVARAIIKGERETQVGHSLNLTCSIASSSSAAIPANRLIRWSHNETTHITYDPHTRSGHQIEIYQSPSGMFSRLMIRHAHIYHAGKYTCSANNAESTAIFVQVHPNSHHPVALRRSSAVPSALASQLLLILPITEALFVLVRGFCPS